MTMKIKFAVSMYTQIINTACSQCKRISKSVWIIGQVTFPGKGNNFNFTKAKLHKICRKLILNEINTQLRK
jgi:hypothetical protein